MSRTLRYTQSAAYDLTDIATSIAISAGDQAVGIDFTRRLRTRCREFADLPGTLGTARPELGQDIRSFPFKGYVIFFRYSDETVDIISILSGRRDVTAYDADE